ncbi:MAG: GNAT family N-acetyltransferase [Bauldia sp.]
MRPRLDPMINTRRLLLRRIEKSDLDDLIAEINDPDVSRMLARVPHPYGRPEAEAYFKMARRSAAAGRSLYFVIDRDGRLIGGIGIGAMPRIHEFGYWLGRNHWGKGYATEAGRAVLAYGFDVLRLPLVRSGVFTDNPASLRLQMKLGFRPLGRGERLSLARGTEVEHIRTVLTRAGFRRGGR